MQTHPPVEPTGLPEVHRGVRDGGFRPVRRHVEVEARVQQHGQRVATFPEPLGDLGTERQVPAEMLTHGVPVEQHGGTGERGTEVEEPAQTGVAARQVELPAIAPPVLPVARVPLPPRQIGHRVRQRHTIETDTVEPPPRGVGGQRTAEQPVPVERERSRRGTAKGRGTGRAGGRRRRAHGVAGETLGRTVGGRFHEPVNSSCAPAPSQGNRPATRRRCPGKAVSGEGTTPSTDSTTGTRSGQLGSTRRSDLPHGQRAEYRARGAG